MGRKPRQSSETGYDHVVTRGNRQEVVFQQITDYSFPIETEASLLEAARYMERHPLEAKLAADPEDDPWSRYRSYVSGQTPPLRVTPSPTYEALGPTPPIRQHAYRRFVEIPQPDDRSMRRTLHLVTAYA